MKLILEITVPEILKAPVVHYMREADIVPDDITDLGNRVFKTGMDTERKEKLCMNLIDCICYTRVSPIKKSNQLKLFEA